MANANALNTPLFGTTGSGNFVGATSATLVTPNIGTPSAGVLTNCTGLAPSTGLATTSGTPSSTTYLRGDNTWQTISGATPAAMTSGNDTNITISLSGTPSTSLLQAVSLTMGWTGTLAVSRGGIGSGSATAYAVICGGTTSTGALQSIASVGLLGQILTSNGGGTLPTFQNPSTGIANIAVSGTTQTAISNARYFLNNASATTVTLPASPALGDVVIIKGNSGAAWIIRANSGQTISSGTAVSTTAGTLTSTFGTDTVMLTCTTPNTTWSVDYFYGQTATTA